MTVKELIEKLKGFDENLEVIVSSEDRDVFYLDEAVINTETWRSKDGKNVKILNISLD